jgi:hypothetical protein
VKELTEQDQYVLSYYHLGYEDAQTGNVAVEPPADPDEIQRREPESRAYFSGVVAARRDQQ